MKQEFQLTVLVRIDSKAMTLEEFKEWATDVFAGCDGGDVVIHSVEQVDGPIVETM